VRLSASYAQCTLKFAGIIYIKNNGKLLTKFPFNVRIKWKEIIMAKKSTLWVTLTLGMIFGIGLFGCTSTGIRNNTAANIEPKFIIIQDMEIPSIMSYGRLFVFPVGTTLKEATKFKGAVAGVYLDTWEGTVTGSGPYTVKMPLYNIGKNGQWTGSGTFDIYMQLWGIGNRFYKINSVNILSKETFVQWSNATQVFLE
jgi:hypothetical protein